MPQTKDVPRPNQDFLDPGYSVYKTFYAIYEAMYHPGERIYVDNELTAPEELNFAAAASCLILLSRKTLLWTDLNWNSENISCLQYHSRYTLISEACLATCALITKPDQMPPLHHFRIGHHDSPASAAVLIIQVDDILINRGKKIAGPGIKKPARLKPKGMPNDFWKQWLPTTKRDDIKMVVEVLSNLTECEKIAILGNHDQWDGVETEKRLTRELEK